MTNTIHIARDAGYRLRPILAIMILSVGFAVSSVAREPQRFLFVLDTSASLSRFDVQYRQSVFDVIYSGLAQHMRKGDTFGVWFFSEQTDTRFPMQTWDDDKAVDLASKATLQLKSLGYRGK